MIPEEDLEDLAHTVHDYQFSHGSLLKAPPKSGKVFARPVGAAMFPSPFPRKCFEQARRSYAAFNHLYANVASDEAWLGEALQPLLRTESLAKILWDIHQAVKREGFVQRISLGIWRSDYMLHADGDKLNDRGAGDRQEGSGAEDVSIKQVEFNTFSCAGGVHSNRISDMHKYDSLV